MVAQRSVVTILRSNSGYFIPTILYLQHWCATAALYKFSLDERIQSCFQNSAIFCMPSCVPNALFRLEIELLSIGNEVWQLITSQWLYLD